MVDSGILIVDDETTILKITISVFTVAGLQVYWAENGEDALRLLAGWPLRLLITDWHMPGLNGLELAEKARILKPDLRIVLTTAGDPPSPTQLKAAGISCVLRKPFRMKALLDLLDPEDAPAQG
ncbi:MAG: response regulator [Desulfuromonadales bacterium]